MLIKTQVGFVMGRAFSLRSIRRGGALFATAQYARRSSDNYFKYYQEIQICIFRTRSEIDFAVVFRVCRTDETVLFHLIDDFTRFGVTDAEFALK